MDILNIGVPEFAFILLIALIILGPKDMQKAGKTIGTWMRKVVLSDEWKDIKNASRRLKTLPNKLMREANLDELSEEFNESNKYRNDKVRVNPPRNNYGTWDGKPTSQLPEDGYTIASPDMDENPAAPVDNGSDSVKATTAQPDTEADNPTPINPDNA